MAAQRDTTSRRKARPRRTSVDRAKAERQKAWYSENVRRRREQLGMSRNELATRTGQSNARIKEIEEDLRSLPGSDVDRMLSDALDVPVGSLAMDPRELALLDLNTHEGRVRAFLRGVADRALEEEVLFQPPHDSAQELRDFLIPPAIVREEAVELGEADDDDLRPTVDDLARQFGCATRTASGESFARFLSSLRRDAVVIGHPGEGKTTAVWWYVCKQYLAAAEALSHGAELPAALAWAQIPLVVSLRAVGPDVEDLLDFAADSMLRRSGLAGEPARKVKEWLSELRESPEQLLLILDAVDELPPGLESHLRKLLKEVAPVRVVFTSRHYGLARIPLITPQRLVRARMAGFGRPEVGEFITRFFGRSLDKAADVRRALELEPEVRWLARVPLLLAGLCAERLLGDEFTAPRTRTQMLSAGLDALMLRGDREKRGLSENRPHRNREKATALQEAAWAMFGAGPRAGPEAVWAGHLEKALACFRHPPESGFALFRELVEDGVLVRTTGESFGFVVRPLHELCVGRKVADLAERAKSVSAFLETVRGDGAQWGRPDWGRMRPLNQPAWSPVWPLAAGTEQSTAQVVGALDTEARDRDDIELSRLCLLAHAIAEWLGNAQAEPDLVADARARAIDGLRSAIERDQGRSGNQTWTEALARLIDRRDCQRLVDELLRMPTERWAAVSTIRLLSGYGRNEAMTALATYIEAADAEDPSIAIAALEIGRFGTDRARELLLRLLESSTSAGYLQVGCISGLALIADETAVAAILDHLEARNTAVEARLECLEAARWIYHDRVEPAVRRVLLAPPGREADRDAVREVAAEVLGHIGSSASVPALIEVMRRAGNLDVRRSCCDALGRIATSEALLALRSAATRASPINLHALLGLAQAGMVDLPRLFDLARDEESWSDRARLRVVEYCRDLPEERAVVDFLVDRLLHDSSEGVRVAAARSLGFCPHLGPNALRKVRRSEGEPLPEAARAMIAIAECVMGVSREGEGLLEILEQSQLAHLHREAATAAGYVTTKAFRDAISERWLRSQSSGNESLARMLVAAAAEIQQRQGWRLLHSGEWDSPTATE